MMAFVRFSDLSLDGVIRWYDTVKMLNYTILFYLIMHWKSTVPSESGRIKRHVELNDVE